MRAHSKGVKGVAGFARTPKPNQLPEAGSKKHFKGNKREKLHNVYGGGLDA